MATIMLALPFRAAPAMLATPPDPWSNLSVRHIGVADGLPHPAVYSISQDGRGYLWLATQDGLGRFDGYRFSVLRANSGAKHGLAASGFGRIVSGQGDDMWLGTWGGGLQRLNTATGTIENIDLLQGKLPQGGGKLVESMVWQPDAEVLWLSLRSNGLFRLQPRGGNISRFRYRKNTPGSLHSQYIASLFVDDQGRLWVGGDGGLQRFDADTARFLDIAGAAQLGSGPVRGIAQDAGGDLWVGTRGGGVSRLDRDGQVVQRFRHGATAGSLSSDNVSSLMFDHSGVLWVGTYTQGINRLWPGRKTFERPAKSGGGFGELSSGAIESFFEDRLHKVWVATRGRGVYLYDPAVPMLRRLSGGDTRSNGLLSSKVRALACQCHGSETMLWIGTDGQGLLRLDPATGSVRQYRHDPRRSDSISSDVITSVVVDQHSAVWAGTLRNGLDRALIGGDSLTFEHYAHDEHRATSLSSDFVQNVYQDPGGTLWVATIAGLDRWLPGLRKGGFQHFRHQSNLKSSLPAGAVFALLADGAGGLWVGTSTGLGYLEVATGQVKTVDTSLGHTVTNVLSLGHSTAQPKLLWIGSSNGLIQLNMHTGLVHRYGVAQGLPGSSIGAIATADAGDLWLSAGPGLTRFNLNDGVFHNYGEFAQSPVVGFNRTALLKMPDGTLLIGGFGGLAVLDPSSEQHENPVPGVALSRVSVNEVDVAGSPWRFQGPLHLDYHHNTVAFEFVLLDYRDPKSHAYAYRMDGVDDDWVWSRNSRVARYAGLDPGSYRFHYKGSTRDGQWSAVPGRIDIVISAAWWQRIWARAAMLLLAAAVVFGGVRWRLHVVDRRNRELRGLNQALWVEIERRKRAEADVLQAQKMQVVGSLAGGVAHDFNNMLQAIQGYIELALNRLGIEQKTTDLLHQALAGIRRAAQLVRRLLTFSRPSPDQLRPLRMQELVREVLTLLAGTVPPEIKIMLDIDDECGPVLADATQMHQVILNLCSNALHAMRGQSGELRIGLDEVAGHPGEEALPDDALCERLVRLRIVDTGPGLAEEVQSRLFDPFFTTRQRTGGTGLGLAIAHSIVRNSGGVIRAFNNAGAGCTFEVVLPVLTREFSEEISSGAVREASRDVGRLLCVDDEPVLANVLRLGFEAHGVEVDAFTNPHEAVTRVEREPGRYAAAIVDQHMPVMSGLKLAARLRTLHPGLPILLLSGSPPADIRKDPEFVHVSALVTKPARIAELLAAVLDVL